MNSIISSPQNGLSRDFFPWENGVCVCVCEWVGGWGVGNHFFLFQPCLKSSMLTVFLKVLSGRQRKRLRIIVIVSGRFLMRTLQAYLFQDGSREVWTTGKKPLSRYVARRVSSLANKQTFIRFIRHRLGNDRSHELSLCAHA